MIPKILAISALVAACSLPAHALSVLGTSSTPGNGIADYSGPGLLSFDADFGALGSVSAEYRIDDGDRLVDFSALVRNLTGVGLESIGIRLSAGGFSGIGTVTRFFGGDAQVLGAGSDSVAIHFDVPEFFDTEIGDVFGTPGRSNWALDFSGLRVGDSVTVTVTAVPEPGTLALLAAAMGLGLFARRRST